MGSSGMDAAELAALGYFSKPDAVRFDMAAGVLSTPHGTRLCAVNLDFLRGFVGACVHETGPAAREILTSCGQHFGRRLARRMETELNQRVSGTLRELEMFQFDGVLREMWRSFGMGRVEFDWAVGRERGVIPIRLIHSPMLGVHVEEDRRDALMTGLLEGFFNHFASDPFGCVQTQLPDGPEDSAEYFVLLPPSRAEQVKAWATQGLGHEEIVRRLLA